MERVRDDIGPYLQERWLKLADHPLVGEARMTGLMGALELVPAKPARKRFAGDGSIGLRCREHSFRNGLVMRHVHDTMVIAPPLRAEPRGGRRVDPTRHPDARHDARRPEARRPHGLNLHMAWAAIARPCPTFGFLSAERFG